MNDLIARHNSWYPAESRLAMGPRTGEFALVNGRSYRMSPPGRGCLLERFLPALERVRATF